MERVLVSLVAFAIFVGVGVCAGDVPPTMSYQGVLYDDVGSPVPDGEYPLTFRLYTVASGGTAIWTEAQTVVVEDGVLNVILGSVSPLGLPFDQQYWLGITINADPELTPRLELASAPYAFRAKNADTAASDGDWVISGADVYRSAGSVGIGTPSPTANLHIREDTNGTVGITIENRDTGSSSAERISFNDENGSVAGIVLYDDGSPYSNAMVVANNRPGGNIRLATGGSEKVRVDNAGNVGIGETGPSAKLDVAGDIETDAFRMPTGAVDGHILTSDASGNGTWQSGGTSSVLIESFIEQTWTTIGSTPTQHDNARVTMNAPGAGHIVITSNVWLSLSHTLGTPDLVRICHSDSPTTLGPLYSSVSWEVQGGLPTDTSLNRTFSVHSTHEVAEAGTYTYYLVGQMVQGQDADDQFWYSQMTAVYYPSP
jgi:hypothetical protein